MSAAPQPQALPGLGPQQRANHRQQIAASVGGHPGYRAAGVLVGVGDPLQHRVQDGWRRPVCCMAVTVAPAPDRRANPVLDLVLEVPDASDEAVYLPAMKFRLQQVVGPPQLPVLPHSPGDAPALFDGHDRPPPSISACTTQQRSDSVPMPSWHATRVTTPKRSSLGSSPAPFPIPAADLRGLTRGGGKGRSAYQPSFSAPCRPAREAWGRHRHPGESWCPA